MFSVVGSQESRAPRSPNLVLIFDDASDFNDAAIGGYAPRIRKFVSDICQKRSRLATLQLTAFERARVCSAPPD
jgi:hypothetical protein